MVGILEILNNNRTDQNYIERDEYAEITSLLMRLKSEPQQSRNKVTLE